LGKDSVKPFDCCSLTLQPCRIPVTTSQGILFEKEAILEYIVTRKQENVKKMKEWEKQQKKLAEEEEAREEAAHAERVRKFITQESVPTVRHKFEDFMKSKDDEPTSSSSITSSPAIAGKKRGPVRSFWTPDQMPLAKKTRLEKPDQKVYCPVSGNILKMKDLFPVKFTPILNEVDKPSKKHRWMCAVSHDILTDAIPIAVLKPSGVVVTIEVVEKIIKKDMIDPVTGEKLTEEDIIPMKRGGTGFAATNELDAKKARPNMELA